MVRRTGRRVNVSLLSKENLLRRQQCCLLFAILFIVGGISMIIVAIVLGTFYLIGPGTTLIVWSVLCGCGSFRYYQLYVNASRAPQTSHAEAQRQTQLPQAYTNAGLNQYGDNSSSYFDPNAPVSPPYGYTSPGTNAAPPTYESVTGYTNWK
ncbi:uncharacterized protein LOC120331092 [Styela clava]